MMFAFCLNIFAIGSVWLMSKWLIWVKRVQHESRRLVKPFTEGQDKHEYVVAEGRIP